MQSVELARSHLALDAKREHDLSELDDALRALEDEQIACDRDLEHAYLQPGVALRVAIPGR